MYLLPKIHKRLYDVPGRPVISNCGTPTERVSEFLDHHLKPVMRAGKSYIRDTGHFIEKIRELGKIPENAILVTADVVGLYPSIPHEAGLEALSIKLEERVEKTVPSEDLMQMAEFVLKNNYFEFNSQVKRQISGTAIGTKFAPPYACIFMDKFENEFLNEEVDQPWIWLRYIDDIFFVWTEGEEKLVGFLERLNSFHSNLKFTHEHSCVSINFLDVLVKIEGDSFVTDLFCKPTDGHQFLEYGSSHPIHVKRSIVYSQGLRIKRICSLENDVDKRLKMLHGWFIKRGYPEQLVNTQLHRVRLHRREGLLTRAQNVREKGVPLVVTFHPLLGELGSIVRKHINILYLDLAVKKVFTPPPFVSFRSGFSLKNHLVRAKVYPLDRETGSYKCGKPRCLTCLNIQEVSFFQSSVDGKQYKINHRLNCDDKCLIYLLSCKVCGKQYVGQTTDKFRFRWNNYKACQRKAVLGQEHPQSFFHQHFLSADHNGLLEDCKIFLIDKTDASDPTRRESFWIRRLKTICPEGLNTDVNS